MLPHGHVPAHDTGSSRRRRLLCLFPMVLLLGTMTWFAVASSGIATANPVVCATVSYSVQGGPTNYVVRNCFIQSTDPPREGAGPECGTVEPSILKVCGSVTLSHPAP